MNMDIAPRFVYEISDSGAVIWRCFSHASKAVLPKYLEGCPVTAIAPYAFSGHMDEKMLVGKKVTCWDEKMLPDKNVACTDETNILQAVHLQEFKHLCGNDLEEIEIPSTVERVGRYCFYNCKNLHRISFTGNLKDWGSGAFTGCHQVRELEVTMYQEETSTLKDILTELQEPLVVDYQLKNETSGYCAKLVFPDYYEDGVENTPAKLINIAIYGSGLKFRNCFQKRVFDFVEYDSRFSYAVAEEEFETAALMAEYRLRYPHGLQKKAQEVFENFLIEHCGEYGAFLIERRDLEALLWYVELFLAKKSIDEGLSLLDSFIDKAALKQYQEGVSYLMDYKHRHQTVKKKKTYDFDL